MTDKKRGIGTVMVEQLRAGKTNDAVLEAVKVEFPESNTSKATVSWYRNSLRAKGETVPTAREAAASVAGAEQPAE